MSTEVPLKLLLEPGEYQCYTSLPDPEGTPVRLGGILSLQPNRPPELSLHGSIPSVANINPANGETWYTYPQVSQLAVLRIELVRGNEVLLFDCTVDKWMPGQAIVTAAAALVGVTIPPVEHDLRIRSLTVQVSGAAAVTSPPPLGEVTFPIKREPDVPLTWSATERLPRRVTDADDQAEVSAYWHASFSGGDGYGHRVSFSPLLEITLADPVDLDTLRQEWIEPLLRILSLSTGRVETVTYLDVEPEGHTGRELQVFGTNITQQPYAPRQSDLIKINPVFRSYGDDTSLLELCRGWQQARDNHHPLVETLGAFLSLPRQHPRASFLLLIQALEGLHGHAYAVELDARLVRHRTSRDQARQAVKNCDGLDPEVRRFIRANLPPRPAASLDHALVRVVGDLPVDLTSQLSDLGLVTCLVAEGDQATDWASALRIVRNGLSHGSRGWAAELLKPAADLLEVIARAHLMQAIGVGPPAVQRYLEAKA